MKLGHLKGAELTELDFCFWNEKKKILVRSQEEKPYFGDYFWRFLLTSLNPGIKILWNFIFMPSLPWNLVLIVYWELDPFLETALLLFFSFLFLRYDSSNAEVWWTWNLNMVYCMHSVHQGLVPLAWIFHSPFKTPQPRCWKFRFPLLFFFPWLMKFSQRGAFPD